MYILRKCLAYCCERAICALLFSSCLGSDVLLKLSPFPEHTPSPPSSPPLLPLINLQQYEVLNRKTNTNENRHYPRHLTALCLFFVVRFLSRGTKSTTAAGKRGAPAHRGSEGGRPADGERAQGMARRLRYDVCFTTHHAVIFVTYLCLFCWSRGVLAKG